MAASTLFPVENGSNYYIEWVYSNVASPFNWSLNTISCVPPIVQTFTSTTDITLSEATLSWQGAGSEMLWEIELLDFTAGETIQGLGTIISNVNTPTYTFTNLNEDHQYNAYIRTDCGGGSVSNWSGPAIFTTLTTCPKPNGSISTVTDTTVLVEWTPGDAEEMWEVEIENLLPETFYLAFVRADCGSGDFSRWDGVGSFETAEPPIDPVDYLYEFSDVFFSGWLQAGSGLPSEGPTGSSSDWRRTNFGHQPGGSPAARINLFNNNDQEWLISPVFSLASGGAYYLNMDVACTDFNDTVSSPMGSDDEVRVLISPNNGVNWLTLKTWTVANQPSAEGEAMEEIDLSFYAGNTVRIALWATDGEIDDPGIDFDFFVDNFRINSTTLNVSESTIEDFKYFPNPVNNTLNLQAKTAIDDVVIHNLLGQEVMNLKPKTLSHQVNMSDLNDGLYMVTVTISGNTKTFKIVKE